jgi:hypothetical protein
VGHSGGEAPPPPLRRAPVRPLVPPFGPSPRPLRWLHRCRKSPLRPRCGPRAAAAGAADAAGAAGGGGAAGAAQPTAAARPTGPRTTGAPRPCRPSSVGLFLASSPPPRA